MAKVRIGVIGVGQIGKLHIDNYKKIADAEIVAVADINEKEAKRVAGVHNIPNVYSDFRKLLKRDDIEAVDVCLHNNFHMPAAVAALKAGKNVYCEKPMAGAYRDAADMLKTAREKKKKLSIQLSTVFANETKAAKSLIDGGNLGKLYHARSTGFRRRGRPFVDGYGTPPSCRKKIQEAERFTTWAFIISRACFTVSVIPKLSVYPGRPTRKQIWMTRGKK